MTKYFNSGLYEKAFFKKHTDIDLSLDYENIGYNEELLIKHWQGDLDYNDEYELSDMVREIFWEKLSYWNTYYEPLVFDEEKALECNLMPFSYEGVNMLALSGCGMDFSPKLDAYQALVHYTIDKNSQFFSVVNQEYFEYVVGEGVINKMKQILELA